MIQMPRHGILPLRVRLPLKNTGDGLSLQPSVENGARSSKGQTREREKEQAEANAAERRQRRRAPTRNRQQRAPQAGNGGYATVPPPRPGDSSGSNARDARAAARAARDATREQAGQQRGGHWN